MNDSPHRRRLIKAAFGGVLTATAGRFALESVPVFAQTRATGVAENAVVTADLGNQLYLLTAAGINVLARTAPGDTLLVDGGSAATAASLLEAVSGLPQATAIQTLFNTHWHPEQTGANEALGGAGAAIIAQENTRLWLSTDITYPWDGSHFEPLPTGALPNRTFFDTGVLDSGARFGHLPHAAHTDGDMYVFFPADNVLAVGDAITESVWPLVDWWTGGWIGGIVGGLEKILSLCDAQTRVVPARGGLLRRADLERQLAMYNQIYERLAGLLNRGRGPEEAVAAQPTAEFDAEFGPSDDFVRLAFMSLWAYLSPDA